MPYDNVNDGISSIEYFSMRLFATFFFIENRLSNDKLNGRDGQSEMTTYVTNGFIVLLFGCMR